ncbi:VOC family protein [Halobaculum magnesiiphilum]|uniref:VOC family protein n=1 Tax=Halobaculum magnesiiphilum TaxID=1017351 RepID=A0A8T8WFU9_9EURY|nr:VOC family protein [Halobaculum magnesiiphilum]QZP38729.1 VOC family protein [Halobaculum magnesiiphilum]
MSSPDGIVFFRTTSRERVVDWYRETVGCAVWLEQPGCTILERGDFRFGFCDAGGDGDDASDGGADAGDAGGGDADAATETESILTFVYPDRDGVDRMHDRVGDAAREEPHVNERYDIYQFFAADPDGRTVEFQTFLHDLPE